MTRPKSLSALLFGVVLADLIAFGMLMPLLPSYATRFGASPAMVGLLVASYSIMHLLLARAWGRLSDRVGRKPVLLVGFVGSVGAALLFAYADSVGLLLLSRILAGGLGATVNVAQAYYADITPEASRTRAMGLLGAAYGIGFILGPAIGGAASLVGDAWPGLAAAGFAAMSLLGSAFALPESRSDRVPLPDDGPTATANVSLTRTLAAGFGITMAFTVMYVVFPLVAEQSLGYDRSQVSYLFVFLGVVNAAAQGGVVGRMAPLVGERALMTGGGLLMAIGFLVLPLSIGNGNLGAPWLFFGALFVVALGYGLAGPAVAGTLSRSVAADRQGQVLGTLQSVNSAARVAGPLFAGVVLQVGDATAAFLTSAIAGLAAAVLARGAIGVPLRPTAESSRGAPSARL